MKTSPSANENHSASQRKNPIRKRAAMIAAQLRACRLASRALGYGQILKLVDRQMISISKAAGGR